MSTDITLPEFITEDADTIHDRMLNEAPEDINIMEGDFFWSITRPVSKEIAKTKQVQLKNFIKLVFPQTSYGGYLDLIGESEGMSRKLSDKSSGTLKVIGKPGTVLEEGKIVSTVSTDKIQSIEFEFVETKTIDDSCVAYIKIKCLKDGSIGNTKAGTIILLTTSINGVESITNETDITNGVDIESDKDYLERILEKKQTPATSGNKYHYRNWAKEVTGVGDVKVFPLWNGNGTVKVVIINSNKRAAGNDLVKAVQDYIDPIPQGTGEGQAPIGAVCTVVSTSEKAINITVTLVIDTKKYTLSQIRESIEANSVDYFASIAFVNNYVSYANIGNLIFNTDGVIDYSNLLVNGGTANVILGDEEIPILGTVSLGV